jgi:hypothetical protein
MNDPIIPWPEFQRNVGIYQIIAGYIFTFAMGFVMQPLVKAWRLRSRYKEVKGRYSVQRLYPEGRIETRDGEIRIEPRWWKGFFAVTAFHAGGKKQWEGRMYLSPDTSDVGQGVFWHVDKGAGLGDQQFRYRPELKQFLVQGVTFGPGASDSFHHSWTKKT